MCQLDRSEIALLNSSRRHRLVGRRRPINDLPLDPGLEPPDRRTLRGCVRKEARTRKPEPDDSLWPGHRPPPVASAVEGERPAEVAFAFFATFVVSSPESLSARSHPVRYDRPEFTWSCMSAR